ncbi:MAG TPA: bifunctional UDP-N-acetylglucosamine diphosphorylase/glucosamine-1-phosphate N-acetyltransferase GlmU [Bryobacteraceae bacterium]|nr:bifunctional UDP-N-acetylglucosamine diphosphorylase/glucosamine-1-phosphate N-acetyltransferase GlmU [Bryobacteraceae bacterium]
MDDRVTVVILAAGLGTRMKSRRAKVLHEAGGKTLIEHTVDTALSIAPAERVFVVIGYQAGQVRRVVEGRGVRFIEQTEQRGTGHALIAGREQLEPLGGLLVVYYGDCPLIPPSVLKALIEQQKHSNAAGTLVSAELEDPTGYGRVIRDSAGRVLSVVEQKAGTPEQLAIREANVGIYCFRAGPLWKHIQELRTDNPANEYYLTDMVGILKGAGYAIDAFRADHPLELLGINNRVELAAADRTCRERKIQQLMLAGVTVVKPETVTVDGPVSIGIDTIIEPFAQVLGHTRIGEACRIGACSVVRDAELGDGVQVGPFTMINASRVGAGAHVGPYARLRLENEVAPGAHIGNFVELKKTRMGAGAKAMHLAYLGDSTIGEDVNVGAGTITCNYDGRAKHQTKIGKGVFVGSNATLVAPVEIGDGAYLAAGSVITDPVPADALALGRARQVTKEGWARKRRETTRTKA